MKGAVVTQGLLLLVAVLYPVGVYFGLKVMPPSFFGLVLIVVLALRFGALGQGERRLLLPVLAVFLCYALLAAWMDSERFLMAYPVLVNTSLFLLFGWSLQGGESMMYRFAKARGMKMSPYAPAYLRNLTKVWMLFFIMNGLIAAWTVTQSMEVWAVYNGLVAYILIGLLIGGEWLFRIHYKKKKRRLDHLRPTP